MTYEKALEMFECGKRDTECEVKKELYEIALEAIKKQIPQKPLENEPMWAVCPNCKGSIHKDNIWEHIVEGDTTFCEHCGQALDWSEDE